MDTKRCLKCKRLKPLDDYYRYPKRLADRGDAEGYRSRCKDCIRKANRRYKAENKEAMASYAQQWRAERKADELAGLRQPPKRKKQARRKKT